MSFWLRAAEGLLEEVDRRAKQVVGEHLDEQSEIQTAVSEQDVLGRAHSQNSKGKGPRKTSLSKPSAKSNGSPKDSLQDVTQLVDSNGSPKKEKLSLSQEKRIVTNGSVGPQHTETTVEIIKGMDLAESSVSEVEKSSLLNDGEQKNDVVEELHIKEDDSTGILSPSLMNDMQDKTYDTSSQSALASDSFAVPVLDHETVKCNFGAENDIVTVELLAAKVSSMETPNRDSTGYENETEGSKKKLMEENISPKPSIQNEHKEESRSPVTRVEDQLDEAQGLLKTAVSTGQSKEARLARVCVGLSSRLQEYKSENAQLEELLITEREEKKVFDAQVKQLEREISLAKAATSSVEAEMADALASKNTEIESLRTSIESLKRQSAVAEGKLATLQANTEAVMRNRELTETRMIQALREELASTERREEEERAAHNATRMAAMERETELEQRAAESSAALARIQRTVDERTQKIADLEQKVSMLEIESATLNQELQESEARSRREQKRSTEDANQTSQWLAWQGEAERARQAQREAEAKLSAMEAETQKMRVEISSMKRDAEQYSRQAHVELEKRYRELTDLLYLKQTQLEAMASEKAAAVFQLEKEAKRFRELQATCLAASPYGWIKHTEGSEVLGFRSSQCW
jgi:predicted  nucleic acid-binding Zn-ribbon protein